MTYMVGKMYQRRHKAGYTLAEFGPTMFLAFIILVFPMMAFGTMGLRYAFLLNAARMAVQAASRTKTFLTNSSPTELSAVNTANTIAPIGINGIGNGMISLISVKTYVMVCPLGGTYLQVTTPGPNVPLASPADPQNNSYTCEVVLDCTMQPLFPGAASIMGSIPGFNAPIRTSVRMDCFFENSSNLNQ